MKTEQMSEKKSLLSFNLGKEIFAIPVNKVLEVLEMHKITSVPKMPEHIKGVINFRGEILPVIDTRIKFKLPDISDTSKTVIIVLDLINNGKSLILGAVADSVRDVFEVYDQDIKAVPELSVRYKAEFLHGIIKIGEDFIMLLDIEKVFSLEDVDVISEVKEALVS